ncbi:MAG: DUF1566 domain-containing protein [Nitrospina sp.]|jgi:hypothetical protein|nr:DUF1566 domain-containing protein [Nitrospina sp.]MBT4127979.1 DUF1566 domain-containing protein [Nitrospina sp.]MBT4259904.1 DUF1566 domain-containing protein [Nitrospina sp.]MBT6296921.1 DUF1566 domain-containing protein [Nitrospina sp.]MBT6661942.1 DUF1566 domain-containing protein [Nitrospina sp.]|tara:strand:- start:4278 stop:4700 length:423 start_codon:yes stop_codon:yes gene_type:complete
MGDNKRFTENGNETITDLEMKLIWKKTDSFQDTKKWQNWFKCQDYTEITNIQRFAGSEEWRYPNEDEAWSLFDLSNKNTDKYGDEIYLHSIFGPGSGGTTWTSEVKDSSALIIQYEDGVKVWPSKYANMNMCVRLVRNLI